MGRSASIPDAPGFGLRAALQTLLLALLAGLLLLSAMPARAQASPPATANAEPAILQVFVREGCPHCSDAKQFLATLARERPELRIVLRPVDEDPAAAAELSERSRAAGYWPPGVPTFLYRGQLLIGFDDAAHRGRELRALLDAAAPPPATDPAAAAAPALPPQPSPGSVPTAFGTLSAAELGLPLFTLALGLLDGFNPCAMWLLLFLLSLLVHLRDRRRMALVAGCFVLVSGAVYYAFMAAWLNVFLAVGMSTAVRLALAALALLIAALNLKDAIGPGHGPSLAIPERAKPGLYARMRSVVQAPSLWVALAGVSLLAVLVNLVELLCTAGVPALFTAVLAQQPLGAGAHHAYLALYILAYIADDALMVGLAVAALGNRRLDERAGRRLKALSGLVMLALGLLLLLRPQWLW